MHFVGEFLLETEDDMMRRITSQTQTSLLKTNRIVFIFLFIGITINSLFAQTPVATITPSPVASPGAAAPILNADESPKYTEEETRNLKEKNPGVAAEDGKKSSKTKKQTNQKSKLTRDEAEANADKRKLNLNVGEDKIVDLDFAMDPDLNKVLTVNTKFVTIRPVTVAGEIRQLVLSPLAAGETTIYIRDGVTGEVKLLFDTTITAGSNLQRRAAELKDLFKDIEGIEIKVLGQKIVIDGDVLVAQDYGRIYAVISDPVYQPIVLPLVGLSPLSLNTLSKEIKRQINAFAPNVNTRVSNGMIFLEGTVDDSTQAARANALAMLYLPEARPGNTVALKDPGAVSVSGGRKLIQNFILVNPPPPRKTDKLIRVTVHYVELKKDYNKAFGFNWNPTFATDGPSVSFGQNSNGTAASSGGSFAATVGNLLPKLSNANTAAFARILKQGTVIVKSGGKAVFKDQIVTPITSLSATGVPQNTGNTTTGFNATIEAQIVGQSDDVLMNLSLENSAVIGASTTTSNKSFSTVVYVRSRESAAIGGIDSGTVTTDFNRQPASGSTGSSFFNLNRSKESTKQKGQFVMFVTPEIIENASDGSADLKKNFRIKVK